jgi:hypothetical protein
MPYTIFGNRYSKGKKMTPQAAQVPENLRADADQGATVIMTQGVYMKGKLYKRLQARQEDTMQERIQDHIRWSKMTPLERLRERWSKTG